MGHLLNKSVVTVGHEHGEFRKVYHLRPHLHFWTAEGGQGQVGVGSAGGIRPSDILGHVSVQLPTSWPESDARGCWRDHRACL